MQQGLSPAELEAALRLVTHFPLGMSTEFLSRVNGARAEMLEAAIREMVKNLAGYAQVTITTDQVPITKKVNKLLQLVDTISVPSVAEFRAADKFKVGETVDGVKIYEVMGDKFKKFFLQKVEENVSAVEIRVHRLLRDSKDLKICFEIGEEKEETMLAQLWEILKLQGNGQKGALLTTNGCANIFYIRDVDGNLWAVYASWDGGGWSLDAGSVGYPYEWVAGHQVCSR